jgi:hypothetical protein
MTEYNIIAPGRRASGARNLNISALNKNKIHNQYVGNSNLKEPSIHRFARGQTNDIPVITNGQLLTSSMNEPDAYNKYSRLENSAFSYPTLKKWSPSQDNLSINKLQESKLKETLVSKINNLLPKVEILEKTAILPDYENTLKAMKSILTSMAVNLLYNEETQADSDKITEIEKWLKLYLLYLNGSNIPPPAYAVPTMFVKPISTAPSAPPLSTLTPTTITMLIKEIRKLIPASSPAINLSKESIAAIVKELGVELPDLLKGMDDARSISSAGPDDPDIAAAADVADVEDIPESPLSSKSAPMSGSKPKISSPVRVSDADKDELNTVLGRDAKPSEVISYTLFKNI